ncbi:hypothetical protein V2I01_34005 [Micromonospora sp. BRA006-A]|nr:hypothetical protein [Micromonospora sp. BRA006-A]
MTTVHRRCDGRYLVVCEGAPENLLAAPLVDADAAELAELTDAAHRLATEGLRVLAVASAVVDTLPDPARPTGLRPLGLVAVGDPLRAAAPASPPASRRPGSSSPATTRRPPPRSADGSGSGATATRSPTATTATRAAPTRNPGVADPAGTEARHHRRPPEPGAWWR